MNKEEFLNGFEFVEAIATDFDQYHIFHNPEARLFAFGRVGSPDLFQLGNKYQILFFLFVRIRINQSDYRKMEISMQLIGYCS